jgi:hypothetical protein
MMSKTLPVVVTLFPHILLHRSLAFAKAHGSLTYERELGDAVLAPCVSNCLSLIPGLLLSPYGPEAMGTRGGKSTFFQGS